MNTIFIKIWFDRCIMVVQNELEKLGLGIKNIKLGRSNSFQRNNISGKRCFGKTLGAIGI